MFLRTATMGSNTSGSTLRIASAGNSKANIVSIYDLTSGVLETKAGQSIVDILRIL